MELLQFFKSVIDQDRAAVVICDLSHTIIYMNPAAVERYKKRGDLLGKSLSDCHNERSNELIRRVLDWFAEDKAHNIVHTFYNEKENKDVYMIALRDESGKLIGYYEKHEYRGRDNSALYDFE